MANTCPICGKPTYMVYGKYPRKDGLCSECGKRLNNHEIEQCPDCGAWKEVNKTCKCKVKKTEPAKVEQVESAGPIVIDKGIRCIMCGYETDGKLFCKKCYAKYCNKEILIKIKNCREIVALDESYEGYYECDDGHIVKSMAERDIDDYLFAHNIKHGYESALLLTDDNGKKVTLHPDFCVFDPATGEPLYYIEYWGYDESNRDYTKTKKYKVALYEKAGITLININAKSDQKTLKKNLEYKIKNYIPGKINFLND